MKPFALFLSCSFFFTANAQKAIVTTPQTMVLYAGFPNPVDIYYPGVAANNLMIQAYTGCEVTKTDGQFLVQPFLNISDCSFLIGIQTGRLIKWVDTAIVPVRNISKGEVKLGELGSGEYSLHRVLAQTKLTFSTNDYFKDLHKNIRFIQYRVILMPKTGPMEMMSFSDASLSDEAAGYISKLKGGDLLVIDDIKITIYGKELRPHPLSITITEELPEPVEIFFDQSFKLDTLSDSTFYYESYFPDGTIYQQGKVMKETRHSAYHYNTDLNPISTEPYEGLLSAIPEGYYPISKWNIFDSAGHHKMTISYMALKDPLKKEQMNSRQTNYTIAPNGECVFYTNNGSIREIIYYNMGKRR